MLTKLVAPITMHTAEETYTRIPMVEHFPSVHMESLSAHDIDEHEYGDLDHRVGSMLLVRDQVAAALEEWKKSEGVKDSQDVDVAIHRDDHLLQDLRSFGTDLANYFRVASVEVIEGEPQIRFSRSTFEKCERSRVRRADVVPTQWNGEVVPLSARDRRALGVS
jgi:isoleucyl-tRNA synthetase